MVKYIVTSNSTWRMKNGTATSIIVTGTDPNITIDGHAVYAGELTATVSGYTGGAITDGNGTGVSTTIGNSQYNISSLGNLVLDNIEIIVSLMGTAQGTPVTATDSVIIDQVNQNYVTEN